MKVNFDSVMLTAQQEIDRLKRQNEMVRKEKDDVLFRRARPRNLPVNVREFATQTDAVPKFNCGVQTDEVEAHRRDRRVDERRRRDEKVSSDDKNRRKETSSKRLRSRSRERSEKSSRQSGSENERKRGRYDVNDNKRDKRDRARRSSERERRENDREKVTLLRTIVCRKLTRISEGQTEETTRPSSERRKSQEKSNLVEETIRLAKDLHSKPKRKPRTPKKALPKQNIVDPIEQQLETLMSESQTKNESKSQKSNTKAVENGSETSNEGSCKDLKSKSKPVNTGLKQVQDLRVLLESKKGRKSSPAKSGLVDVTAKALSDLKIPEKGISVRSEEEVKLHFLPETKAAEEKKDTNNVKEIKKAPVKPLELLW